VRWVPSRSSHARGWLVFTKRTNPFPKHTHYTTRPAQAVLALFSSFDELADMVSISTLFAFWMVALGLVWRRSCTDGAGSAALAEDDGVDASKAVLNVPRNQLGKRRFMTAFLLVLINAGSIIFTIGWRLEDFASSNVKIMLGVGGGLALLSTATLHLMVSPMYTPPRYNAPLYPWLPALSMVLNIFLIGQLSTLAFERFGIWCAACTGMYFLYSGLAAHTKAEHDKTELPTTKAIDLADAKDAAVEMTPPAAK
jgi:APA family basic amino acid/polyamine antiporter